MIPKQIFKIYIGEKFPEHLKQFTDTWQKVNKDYEVIYFNSCDFDSPFIRYAKEKKNNMLINAYMRLKLVYEFGGIYLDNDIECVKSFDSLLNKKCVFGIEDEWTVNLAVILAEAKNPFIKTCLDCLDNFEFNQKGEPALETGPRMLTKLISKLGWKQKHIGEFNEVTVVAPEYFYPYHYTELYSKDCITDKTICIHHWAQTWGDKVSIVIPCYNQGEYLKDAIESALNQTYKNIEVIVVNDGSKDNTREVCKQFKDIIYIEQPNKGLSAARNAGIKASSGKWIVPLDSDDKLHRNFILNTIHKSDIVTTYLQCFGDRKDIWKPAIVKPTHKDFLTGNKIHYCSIFRREIFDRVQYDEEQFSKGKQGVNGYEDWMFWLNATKLGYSVLVHPEVLMYYRKHGFTMIDEATKNRDNILNYMRKFYPISFK